MCYVSGAESSTLASVCGRLTSRGCRDCAYPTHRSGPPQQPPALCVMLHRTTRNLNGQYGTNTAAIRPVQNSPIPWNCCIPNRGGYTWWQRASRHFQNIFSISRRASSQGIGSVAVGWDYITPPLCNEPFGMLSAEHPYMEWCYMAEWR